ncbi:MAG: HDOD domain-containing protein [Deltaproteobacteria bacterium]|nr:HDOD domain-containing protein [Deltaproteobacteria bacterium]
MRANAAGPRASKQHFGIHRIDEHDLPLDATALSSELQARLASPSYTPPILPSAAVRILELSRAPNASMRELVGLFEDDAMLAARVLKTARSASFVSDPDRVRTLQDAAVRLGLKTLRDVVLDVSLNSKIFRSPVYSSAMESLFRHARAVARITKVVCRLTSVASDDAFVAGLFHDVGAVVLLHVLSETRRDSPLPVDEAWPAIMELHQAAGAQVARAWKLSHEVVGAVESHHGMAETEDARLAAALYVADTLAGELSFSAAPSPALLEPKSELMSRRARGLLELDAEQEALLRTHALEAVSGLDA